MRITMDTKKNDLQTFFQKTEGIPQDKVKYYVGRLDRFFQFYNGSLDEVSDDDVKAFGDFLETNGCNDCRNTGRSFICLGFY